MATRGRKSKLTAETALGIVDLVRKGMDLSRAAKQFHLAPRTVWNWMTIGRKQKRGRHADLVRAVEQAEAQFIGAQLAKVVRAATPIPQVVRKTTCHKDGSETTVVTERLASDWKAARWLLEAKAPEEFGGSRHELLRVKKELEECRQLIRQIAEGDNPELLAVLDRRAGGGRARSPSGRFAPKTPPSLPGPQPASPALPAGNDLRGG